MNRGYLPQKPAPLAANKVPAYIGALFARSLAVLKKLLWVHEEQPTPPAKGLPVDDNRDLPGGQRQQSREIYDGSLERLAAVETRASSLVQTVVILVPLALATWVFLWKNSPVLPPWLLRTVLLFCVLSLTSALGAVLAALRAGTVFPIYSPGPESLFDLEKGERREYNAERDAYCLVWCAWMNHALADHRLDFIRAGQVLISAALVFLLLTGITLAPASGAVFLERQEHAELQTLRDTVATQGETLGALEAVVAATKVELESYRLEFDKIRASVEPEPTPNHGLNEAAARQTCGARRAAAGVVWMATRSRFLEAAGRQIPVWGGVQ